MRTDLRLCRVVIALTFSTGWWRDDGCFSCGGHGGQHARLCALSGMGLPGSEEKYCGMAKRVTRGVDFGGQSACAAPESLTRALFALRRYVDARTLVESSMA